MIKIKKIIFIILGIFVLTSCSSFKKATKKEALEGSHAEYSKPVSNKIRIKTTSFSSAILLDCMKDDNDTYDVEHCKSFSEVQNGDFDIALVPAILAPSIYNSSKQSVEISAITLLNNLYAVSKSEILTPKALIGKVIYIPDLGDSYQNMIDSKLGILKKLFGVKIERYKDSQELKEILDKDDFAIAIVSEPNLSKVAGHVDNIYRISDMLSFFPIKSNGKLDDFISEVILVNKNFLKDNKEAFDKFLDDYKASQAKIKNDSKISTDVINKYDINNQDAINIYQNMNNVYIEGDTMVGMYNLFLDYLEKAKLNFYQGDRPSDDFYYRK